MSRFLWVLMKLIILRKNRLIRPLRRNLNCVKINLGCYIRLHLIDFRKLTNSTINQCAFDLLIHFIHLPQLQQYKPMCIPLCLVVNCVDEHTGQVICCVWVVLSESPTVTPVAINDRTSLLPTHFNHLLQLRQYKPVWEPFGISTMPCGSELWQCLHSIILYPPQNHRLAWLYCMLRSSLVVPRQGTDVALNRRPSCMRHSSIPQPFSMRLSEYYRICIFSCI